MQREGDDAAAEEESAKFARWSIHDDSWAVEEEENEAVRAWMVARDEEESEIDFPGRDKWCQIRRGYEIEYERIQPGGCRDDPTELKKEIALWARWSMHGGENEFGKLRKATRPEHYASARRLRPATRPATFETNVDGSVVYDAAGIPVPLRTPGRGN